MTAAISDERIVTHLREMLASPDPGDDVNHLRVEASVAGEVGPLGLPGEDRLSCSVWVILNDGSEPTGMFIRRTITAAAIDYRSRGEVPVFAALSLVTWSVSLVDGDEAGARLAQELARAGRLEEHPDAAETVTVYGVCRDGRRWKGSRYLTGSRAGEPVRDPVLLSGPVVAGEVLGKAGFPLRLLVGMPS